MTAAVFATDRDRTRAAALRRLLMRVENGRGEDRGLSADILEEIGAATLVGDPVSFIQSALYCARVLRQSPFDALRVAVDRLRMLVRQGGVSPEEITESDVARAVCAVVLRTEIANLERAPA